MPFGWVGAAAAVAGTVGSLVKGSGQSGDISAGQSQANAAVQPWVTSGVSANKQQSDLLGLNGQPAADSALTSFQSAPGYQYQVSQGLRAVDAGAASKGSLNSGATIKAEETLGSNLANQNYQQYIGNLNSLSTAGESAGVNQAATDTGAAANQASIYGSAANGVTNSITTGLTNPAVQNGLTSLFSSPTSPTTTTAYNNGTPYQAATTSGDTF